MTEYANLPREDLERMLEAGIEVVDCHRVLAKTGDNIVGEALRGSDSFYEWNHYPESDIYDNVSHSQYYYHTHPPEERPGEHGHFHTFLRPKGMPPGIKPAPIADYEPPEDPDDNLSHLIAISMDDKGFPRGLFTVNRWVTGDVWYVADDVITMVDLFVMDQASPSWAMNRWITGMFRLFRPRIIDLLRGRDRAIADWQKAHPGENAYEAREIEVTSTLDIDIDAQINRVREALG